LFCSFDAAASKLLLGGSTTDVMDLRDLFVNATKAERLGAIGTEPNVMR
jgi:hypothetical protein